MTKTISQMRTMVKTVAILAVSTMMFAACGGNASKKQSADGSTETAQAETKAEAKDAAVAASAGAFSDSDRSNVTDEWFQDLTTYTGIKGIGKPQGSTVKESSRGASHNIFIIRFTTDKSADTFVAYGKSLWDLCKAVVDKGELLDRSKNMMTNEWEQTPITFELSKSSDSCDWYYNFGGSLWEVKVWSDGEDGIELTIEKV
jgi:hypothetical protein